jgi:uncharacterized protein (DUF2147 family)
MKRLGSSIASFVVATTAVCTSSMPAAAEAIGLWRTADGGMTVAISRCADALCGKIASVAAGTANGKTKVGFLLIKDMKPTRSENWAGTVFDPRDGASYQGTLRLLSLDRLQITGCAIGGLVCQGETWTRMRP